MSSQLQSANLGVFVGLTALAAAAGLAGLYSVLVNLININDGADLWANAWFTMFFSYGALICSLIVFGLPILFARKYPKVRIISIMLYQLAFYTAVLIILSIIVYANPSGYSV